MRGGGVNYVEHVEKKNCITTWYGTSCTEKTAKLEEGTGPGYLVHSMYKETMQATSVFELHGS